MTWFKVDDTFWSHPKVIMLAPRAISLWVRSGAWAAAHATDGFVPMKAVRLCGSMGAAHELVEVGLWEEAMDGDNLTGFVFHDWADYQPTREEVEKKKEKNRQRMKRARAQRVHDPVTDRNVVSLTPTRPDPTRQGRSGQSVNSPTPTPPSAREALAAIEHAHQQDTDQEQQP